MFPVSAGILRGTGEPGDSDRPFQPSVAAADRGRRPVNRLPGAQPLRPDREDLLPTRNARILLGLGLAASGALLLAWQSHLTFLVDDWDLLLSRRGFNAHAFLDPHARHLVLGPALVYKAIQATLGMDRSFPTGRRDRLLPRQRSPPLHLPEQAGRRLARARRDAACAGDGHGLSGPPHAFQMGYFGSVAFGIRRAARDRARRPTGRRGRVCAAARLARVRRDRPGLRSRRARRDRPAARSVAAPLDHRGPGPAVRRLVRQLRKPLEPAERSVRP